MVGCPGSSDDSKSVSGSISGAINNIIGSDSSTNSAEKEVANIQNALNKDSSYALNSDDIDLLKTQGLISDDSEIKSWVK